MYPFLIMVLFVKTLDCVWRRKIHKSIAHISLLLKNIKVVRNT